MISDDIFPPEVREVIDFVKSGPILQSSYRGEISIDEMYFDIKAALKNYTNQDVKPPKYFLTDITEDASGDIPAVMGDERLMDLKYKLIEYEEQEDFYQILLDRCNFLKNEIQIKPKDIELIADAMSGNLYLCAESRLLIPGAHLYFERLFEVHKLQGFPCGWKGGKKWQKGDFLIYSRPIIG
ncbi:hypothetical protein [Acidovorax sp. NCPPB 3576]|uniref:hypothetical protein n=1 Tax=Acidovorax sp. NCPPB 3576 TaxID=2940488 RepID=UPI0023497746|nr:hypothetical protein [Acidovorax sp. NCPPB 3576]WCM89479.1 hypothetical protein M5C98_05355 [Acidovorax sp. NCPPB 3576]